MLLPSTLPSGPRPRLQRMEAYKTDDQSQPASPMSTTTPQGTGGTCNALQSILGTRSQRSSGSRSPIGKSHLRSRSLKRPPPPGMLSSLRKRRLDDHLDDQDGAERVLAGHGYGLESRVWGMTEGDRAEQRDQAGDSVRGKVSTPKRARKMPTAVPFGLSHDDILSLDEALDDEMVVEDFGKGIGGGSLPLDEGYGSMEFRTDRPRSRPQIPVTVEEIIQADPASQYNFPVFRDGEAHLHPRSGPASELDAMSISTPNSGLGMLSPAQALSPEERERTSVSPNLGIPDIRLSDPSPSSASPSDGPSSSDQFNMSTTSPDTPDSPEIPLPELPPAYLDTKKTPTRPTISRLPSLAHSDPFLPTPSTPTHPLQDPFETSDTYPPNQPSMTATTPPAQSTTHSSWTDADDRALVSLVVDKLRLKKSEWDACARAMGAHGHGASLGRRWRELVGDGCVGLKFRYGGAVVRRSARQPQDVNGDDGDEDGSGAGDWDVGRRITSGARARRGDVRAVRWT